MSKKVIILEGSPRIGGNTDLLAEAFLQGVVEAGHTGEKIALAWKNIHPCLGCDYCRNSGKNECVYTDRDDFEEIIQKVIAADVLVLASPVYFYSFTAQMKTAIDRFYAREFEVKDKTAYLITAGAAPTEDYMETMTSCFRDFLACFENLKEGGILKACGVGAKGDVNSTPYLEQARQMGKAL